MDDFQRLGGEAGVRALVADFVRRCYGDVMIGFLFKRADPIKLAEHEYQLLASKLGAPVTYEGRPLREAHAPHRILGGQFDRRRTLLDQTLADHRCPDDLRRAILADQESLRSLVTVQGSSSGCLPEESP